MKPRRIHDDIFWMGAIDWDRRLFDSLIPLPEGTSYNAYLVQGREKTVLVDTVDPPMLGVLMEQLRDVPRIDYVISNHSEQDHSGAIAAVLEKYAAAKLLCTPQAKFILMDHLGIAEGRFRTVGDGETIALGGKTLEFIHTPWVHWPETMVTYLREDQILFSCDFFGSHLATSDISVKNGEEVYRAAKRYYAEIMMPFRKIIRKNLEKVRSRPLRLIAPSHGPVLGDPEFILAAYEDWASEVPKNSAVIPFVSMHGSTARMVEHLVGALAERGLDVHPFNMAGADIGELAMSLVDAATIILGTPCVHLGPHPQIAYSALLANALRPKAKFASIVGSFGWNQKIIDQIAGLIPNLKVEILPPVLCKGYPQERDLKEIDTLAEAVLQKHKGLNLV